VRGLRRYLVELVATLLLTLTVLGAASQDVLLGALAIGSVVAVLLGTGAHANPVLTLAAVLGRRLPASDLLPCWAAQLVGALLGAALGRWLVDAPAVSPLQDLGVLALLVAQLVFAFLLCYAVLAGDRGDGGAATVAAGQWAGNGWSATAGGLTVVAAAAVLDPVAASGFNPAAAFGQVVAGISEWSTIWVYLVGGPAGAALAGLAARQPSSRPG
jgi:aquaporin Z